MFVYRLIRKTEIDESIEISDDDDDNVVGDKDVKPVISNGIVKTEPAKKVNDANRLVTNSSARKNDGMLVFFYITSYDLYYCFFAFKICAIEWNFAEIASTSRAATNISTSPLPIDENQDDDNELIYSQQVLMEIKKEVSYSEEVITLDDDFTICISDESSDDESNQWAGKLSQDQDFVVKKVTESTQSKKRKITKQIDPMPLIPSKRGRRNSVSSNIPSSSKKASTTTATAASTAASALKQPPKVKNEPKHENDSSATNGAPKLSTAHSLVPPTAKNTQKNTFVDRLDPFVKKTEQKTEKAKTFDDAIALKIVEPKKRVANRPKRKFISILRKKNGAWPSELSPHGHKAKSMRRVHFSEENFAEIREYEPNDHENGEIIIAAPTKPMTERAAQSNTVPSNSFENDPLHEIITDITEWKTEWLLQRNATPPINGVNLIVCPLMNAYASFENYKG